MFAKSASLFTSFGVNYSTAPLKKGSYKKFTVFAKSASSLTSCRVDYSMTRLEEGGEIFKLTLKGDHGRDAHYLTPALLESFSSELHRVKKNATHRCVLITTAQGENFCQGFDPSVQNKDGYLGVIESFRQLVKDLISLPMPTIAAVNGCTRGAGLILAMSHDHLTLTTDKDFLLCEEGELDNKMTLPDYFTAMLRSKVTPGDSARLVRNGLTFTYEEAKEIFGLAVVPTKGRGMLYDAENLAKGLLVQQWDGGVYAETRKALYPDLYGALDKVVNPC